MSTEFKEIYENLYNKDISEFVQERSAGGNAKLSYLPWANAWHCLMEEYPDSTFKIEQERRLEGGSVEVRVEITVGNNTRSMFLPVMGNRNEAIENPDTRQISDARMRCLVKCLALFGLGASLFQRQAEDVPDLDAPMKWLLRHNEAVRDNLDSVYAIKQGIALDNYSAAYEAWSELDEDTQRALWVAPSKGGIFTTAERGAMKSSEWNEARQIHHNIIAEDE